ncbi:asparagine synthetase, variant [Capsaspora owczarzaki ATCC 30864]|uniref:asparagine synthase (glutamine-hydrolyzing) n=1 Tax=Capsaspora owczarzaki (strain ATCC 30864) TaxID=595528 RepID=A0A0D2X1X3_CAPO3|nr:asparagine synthetase, variant [Capsaspora owczarzaki ATCC 30864]
MKHSSWHVLLRYSLRHRGPDWNGLKIVGNNALAHERQAIVDLDNGAQPLTDANNKFILSVNGEIYNHQHHRKQLGESYQFQTGSDCEVIIPLYIKHGTQLAEHLDGMFSFVLYDVENDTHIVARDPIGITPLYRGWGDDGSLWYASEAKSLKDNCSRIEVFPPGHLFSSKTGLVRYYQPEWMTSTAIPTQPCDLKLLRETFEAAVIKRLMCDVPFGVLLSGGLDSSLVAAIASRHLEQLANNPPANDESHVNWWPRLHSFAIGLKNAPDLEAARVVAKHLNTVHHEFHFTIQDGHDALRDVVNHLETYDVTTIRASTPMYLLSRRIKATGVKMVLSGEGSDEIFGGYLYFHKAPSAADLHKETIQRVGNLHLSDCLRANKSTMAWGVEARVPFLDKAFLDVAMSFDPAEKLHRQPTHIEKHVLRKAFDTADKPYLPASVLWRQKEQFSDGVGYSWIDSLKDAAEQAVTDAQLASAAVRFPHDTPQTKEAYWYREMFDEQFPATVASTVMRWIPKGEWGCNADPSGRFQTVHSSAVLADK